MVALSGDRFIVRMFSPVVTIGGGIVLDIAAPTKIRRAGLARRLELLESGDRVALLVAESKHGMSVADLKLTTAAIDFGRYLDEIETKGGPYDPPTLKLKAAPLLAYLPKDESVAA